jgi:hypothetical protein
MSQEYETRWCEVCGRKVYVHSLPGTMQFRARCGEFLVSPSDDRKELSVIDNATEVLDDVKDVTKELNKMFERIGGSVDLIRLVSSLEGMVNKVIPLLNAEKDDIQESTRWHLQECEKRRNDGRHPGPSA